MPKQLLEGESLLIPPLRRHWILLVRGILPAVVVAVFVLLATDVWLGGSLPGDMRLVTTVFVTAVLGLWGLVVWLRWAEDSLTITDQRVLLEEGVLVRNSRVIPLDRVQDVSTSQTLLGRILGYGTVEIDAAGTGGGQRFAYVSRPDRVRDQVFLLAGRLGRPR